VIRLSEVCAFVSTFVITG